MKRIQPFVLLLVVFYLLGCAGSNYGEQRTSAFYISNQSNYTLSVTATTAFNEELTATIPAGERALILEDTDVIFITAQDAMNSLHVLAVGTENPELSYSGVDDEAWELENVEGLVRNYVLLLQDQDLEPPAQ